MRKTVIAAAVLGVFLTAAAASAHALGRGALPGAVGVEIVPDRGGLFQSIPHRDFRHDGTRVSKRYLEARKGENYGIVITNRSPERVGLVIAVDGRNIISGKRSDLKSSEAMYIVNAHETARYDGWRTGGDRVHRFYFTDVRDSYSVRTFADSSAVGVIAVAVFREKERPRLQEKGEGTPAPATPSAGKAPRSVGRPLAEESAGTGFGNAQYSPVVTVQFEPQLYPIQKTLIKYEWREVLCRKGILSCGREFGNRLWDTDEYAPYPPGYRRN